MRSQQLQQNDSFPFSLLMLTDLQTRLELEGCCVQTDFKASAIGRLNALARGGIKVLCFEFYRSPMALAATAFGALFVGGAFG